MKIQPLRSFAHVRAFHVRSVLILLRQETEAFCHQTERSQHTGTLRAGLTVDVEGHLRSGDHAFQRLAARHPLRELMRRRPFLKQVGEYLRRRLVKELVLDVGCRLIERRSDGIGLGVGCHLLSRTPVRATLVQRV